MKHNPCIAFTNGIVQALKYYFAVLTTLVRKNLSISRIIGGKNGSLYSCHNWSSRVDSLLGKENLV